MNKTKIEWCDSTWNPVTGCLHGCEYCYARKIANRFGGYTTGNCLNLINHKEETKEKHVLDNNLWKAPKILMKTQLDKAPYPFGFDPTFHRYRLEEPSKKTKGQNIFVCSMADLFGEWVHLDWIKQVFEACEKAPQHNYLFLTKNPKGIPHSSYMYSGIFNNHRNNFWLGATINTQKDLENRIIDLINVNGNIFLSIEPIFERLNLTKIDVGKAIIDVIKGKEYHLLGGGDFRKIQWIIIGAETGNRKDKIIPKKEWIDSIVKECKKFDIPVFMKDSLIPIMGDENMLREFPEGLRR